MVVEELNDGARAVRCGDAGWRLLCLPQRHRHRNLSAKQLETALLEEAGVADHRRHQLRQDHGEGLSAHLLRQFSLDNIREAAARIRAWLGSRRSA